MAITYGFFNSVNGDRKYDAKQFGDIFKGIISDGVFSNVGNRFAPSASGTQQVTIGTGRAWFDGIWVDNDSPLTLNLEPADVLNQRIDSSFIWIDQSARTAGITILKGSPADKPTPPKAPNTATKKYYRLHNYVRPAKSTGIQPSNVANRVGYDTKYITGPLKTLDFSKSFGQLEGEFQSWMGAMGSKLDGDAAAKLARDLVAAEKRIKELTSRIDMLDKNRWARRKILREKRIDVNGQVTDKQLQSILNGSFDDLYVGDYWVLNNRQWRIVDINYYEDLEGTVGTIAKKPHVVVMPDSHILLGRYNYHQKDFNGYRTSQFRTPHMDKALSIVRAAYPKIHLEPITEYALTYIGKDGKSSNSGVAIHDKLMIPNEYQIYGKRIHGLANSQGARGSYTYTCSDRVFTYFELAPGKARKNNGYDWWLRDVVNNKQAATVHATGVPFARDVTWNCGWRPFFVITGERGS